MIRTASAVLGGVALAVLGGGVANAAPVVQEPPTAPNPAAAGAGNQLWVLDAAPVPIEDPTLGVFDALAPAYALVGGIG